ncbi:MAG: protein-L-isoaspartate(D-aspartate) O-methyltransferase [Gammaproteobacteria bacterium]|nr:protein-L-isoaspartate(D-aspartate) O-methyltransferase [Gammaproteobacteria bacterium]
MLEIKQNPVYKTFIVSFILLLLAGNIEAADEYQQQRDHLVDLIKEDVQLSSEFLEKDRLDTAVLEAIRTVPRHEFVPGNQRRWAYKNRPLPIGFGQTISQPAVVAIMTDLLRLKKTDRVLEIGTGSGYQAAVLAELVDSVYSIEIVDELAKRAAMDLERTGYGQISTRKGDGYYGWESEAPFDSIIVTAAASHIPPPLIKQLKPGGRMIIPVGSRFMLQHLVLVIKDAENNVTTKQILPVKFVPLTGKH